MCGADLFYFFSSRRRHTRFDCDWSSDVCSSDLEVQFACIRHPNLRTGNQACDPTGPMPRLVNLASHAAVEPDNCHSIWFSEKIGRASCRERVLSSVVGGSIIKHA